MLRDARFRAQPP